VLTCTTVSQESFDDLASIRAARPVRTIVARRDRGEQVNTEMRRAEHLQEIVDRQEDEIQRQRNIISDQADEIARLRLQTPTVPADTPFIDA